MQIIQKLLCLHGSSCTFTYFISLRQMTQRLLGVMINELLLFLEMFMLFCYFVLQTILTYPCPSSEKYIRGTHNELTVTINKSDNFVNASRLCLDYKKRFASWANRPTVKQVINAFANLTYVQQPRTISSSSIGIQLHSTIVGTGFKMTWSYLIPGENNQSGIYIHPMIFPLFAMHISPTFYFLASEIIQSLYSQNYGSLLHQTHKCLVDQQALANEKATLVKTLNDQLASKESEIDLLLDQSSRDRNAAQQCFVDYINLHHHLEEQLAVAEASVKHHINLLDAATQQMNELRQQLDINRISVDEKNHEIDLLKQQNAELLALSHKYKDLSDCQTSENNVLHQQMLVQTADMNLLRFDKILADFEIQDCQAKLREHEEDNHQSPCTSTSAERLHTCCIVIKDSGENSDNDDDDNDVNNKVTKQFPYTFFVVLQNTMKSRMKRLNVQYPKNWVLSQISNIRNHKRFLSELTTYLKPHVVFYKKWNFQITGTEKMQTETDLNDGILNFCMNISNSN